MVAAEGKVQLRVQKEGDRGGFKGEEASCPYKGKTLVVVTISWWKSDVNNKERWKYSIMDKQLETSRKIRSE